MLSNDLSTILIVLSAIVCVLATSGCVWRQLLSEKYCRSCMEYVSAQNKRSVSLKKLAQVESELTELTDAYDALITSHKKLRSRIGMRNIREQRNGAADDGIPDPTVDPAGYKRAMRLKLQNQNKI